MRQLRNEEGFVIITALLILMLLTIIGISAVKTSNIELQISTNMLIHKMSFYAAESGIAVGPLWYTQYHKDNDLDLMVIPNADAMAWSDGGSGNLPNGTTYEFTVSYRHDGTSVLMESTTYMPDLLVYSEGTHTRGGLAAVEATFEYRPAVDIPTNPIWAEDSVEITGSATVDSSFRLCSGEDSPEEVKFQNLDYYYTKPGACSDGDCGSEVDLDPFDMSIIDDLISGLPTYTDLPAEAGTYDHDIPLTDNNLKVIHITNSVMINNSDSFVGSGILVIDGDLIVNGGFEWYGVVVVRGVLDATGTANIQGALIAGGDDDIDVDLTGNFNIDYDCELINFVYDTFSGYRLTSWRQR